MNYRQFIEDGKRRLEVAAAECSDPLRHIKLFVEGVLEVDSGELFRRLDAEISQVDHERLERLLQRRLAGEPLQYILGYEWFWESRFEVGPGVLIPRPETELLVEMALAHMPKQSLRVAELGAGSGAIGISLLKERPQWEWVAWEKSPEAFHFAEKNLRRLLPQGNYQLQPGDFFDGIASSGPFHWFVSNPPYVRRADLPGLSEEVRKEPWLALDGGETGFEVVNRLIDCAAKSLISGGGLLVEIGSDQGSLARAALERCGFDNPRIEKDLAGLDRVAYGCKR